MNNYTLKSFKQVKLFIHASQTQHLGLLLASKANLLGYCNLQHHKL